MRRRVILSLLLAAWIISAVPGQAAPAGDLLLAPETGAGRAKNKLRPDPDATGSHAVIKRDAQGNVTGYESYGPQTNPRNPNPWQSDKRVDLQGKRHFDKATGQDVPTPHVHDPGGSVRPANSDEIP